MANETCEQNKGVKLVMQQGGNPSNAIYGLGLIGAAVYFIQHADTFWMGVYGIVKAIVWPAILVYKVLESFRI